MSKKNTPKDIDELLGVDTPRPLEEVEVVKNFDNLPAEVMQALAKLNPKKAAFVMNLAGGMGQADALLRAGWKCSRKSASVTANRILKEDTDVADALHVMRADLAKRAEYNFEKFMDEMNEAIEFAKDTKNATALVRAVELKGKASGHLVERIDQRVSKTGFQLVVQGVEPPKVVSEQ